MPNNDSNYIQTYNHPHGQVLINEQTLTDIADAIREQRLTDDTFKPAQFAGEIIGINEIEGGEYEGEIDLSVEEKDINFYDYDGTRVYSYGKEEFLGLSSLPDNPSHDNLVAQGWNWSLSDAKEYVQKYGILDVGQMYNTKMNNDTGCLEIDIQLKEGYLSPVFSIGCSTNSSFDIYWGDDYSNFISNTGSSVTSSHTYSSPGKYTIIVNTMDGYNDNANYSIIGTSSGSSLLTGGGTNDDIYRNCITDVRVGSCVKDLRNYAFKNCNSLRTVSIHEDLQNISESGFQNCYCLKSIIIPKNISRLETNLFKNCYSLQRIVTPNTIINGQYYIIDSVCQNCYSLKNYILSLDEFNSTLYTNMFKECHSLKKLIIPEYINYLYNTIFQNCYSFQKINCYSTTPPTVDSTTFTDLPTYTKIYVPWSRDHSVLAAYKAATYWSDIADQIYQMPMSIKNTQAYAEFNSSDGSLTFFRDLSNKYINGDIEGTQTYYTGIETTNYTSNSEVPWYNNRTSVTSVTFENEIVPISTAYWFSGMNNASFTSITGFDKLDTSNVTDMQDMFYYCSKLTSLDLSNFNTSNVTNMASMFNDCYHLISLDVSNFDTSNVTDMNRMFSSCEALTSLDLSNFNTNNVTNMQTMFQYCSKLTNLNLSNFNTSNVTNMAYMFYHCNKLTSLNVSNFNTSSVTDMTNMFYGCNSLTSLDVSNFNTSNVTNMTGMFNNCNKLINLNLNSFNTSKVTNMGGMFSGCSALTNLDLNSFNTSEVTNMYYMFASCSAFTAIYVSDRWDVSKVTGSDYMFYDCTNLVGEQGTTYNSSYVDKTYARIDNPPSSPGYLTYKAAPVGGAA